MELEAGASDMYHAYGDAQGDGTMEGAVYGLFAAEPLVHPDGKTGTVYQAGDLVAVAAMDKNGDASFMAITEAPGYTYNYETGGIEPRSPEEPVRGPFNLYVRE